MKTNYLTASLALSLTAIFLVACEQQYDLATISKDAPKVEIGGTADSSGGTPVVIAPQAAPVPVPATNQPTVSQPPVSEPVATQPIATPTASQPVVSQPAPTPTASVPPTDPVADPTPDGGTSTQPSLPPLSDETPVVPLPKPTSVVALPDPSVDAPADNADDSVEPIAPPTVAKEPAQMGRRIILNVASVWVTLSAPKRKVDKNYEVARDIGKVDLLKMSPGVLAKFVAQAGSQLKEVELRLHATGHEVQEDGVVVCQLKVPSLKFQMKFNQAVDLRSGVSYSIQMPESEVQVKQTSTGCSLRPIAFPNLEQK